VREPSARSSAWQCDRHGEVHPLRVLHDQSSEGLPGAMCGAGVPVWLPWPLPPEWLVTGFATAGDERGSACGSAVALSGPNPMGGPGDMLLISEEPGVGLGARFAGLAGPDPGRDFTARAPHAFVQFGSHEFPLWHVAAPGCAAYAGEVMGSWLWLVLWPDTAGVLLLRPMPLRDLRDRSQNLDLPFGPRSRRLGG
jgi:hypothetical protein